METITEAILHLFLLSSSVIAIVTKHRFEIEQRWRQKFGIDRDWWIPIVALLIGISLSLFSTDVILNTILDKIDIIVLIFTFGILAEGLNESDVFTYISYKTIKYCENTTTLIINLFILTSILTLFTTNDVIVLVLTPILIEIAYHSNIKNIKLLLLSQFIAANTLSMGLLVGSPTNIIIAESLSIGFTEYISLMILPALIAFLSSLLILIFSLKSDFLISTPKQNFTQVNEKEIEFTSKMRNWSLIFILFLLLVAVVTELNYSLLYCSVPIIIVSLIYWFSTTERTVTEPIFNLPYGVLFFGLSFFVFAQSFGSLNTIDSLVIPLVKDLIQGPLSASITGLVGSGILVNLFNDLPASALISELLPILNISGAEQIIFIQGTLAGLNIGAYITQVGALAGIIWFNEIRKKDSAYDIDFELPSRYDLIKYGLVNFISATILLSIFFVIEYMILTTYFG